MALQMASPQHEPKRSDSGTAIMQDVSDRRGGRPLAVRVFRPQWSKPMILLRMVTTCACALLVTHAWAQDHASPPNDSPQGTQDVGGATMTRSDAGPPTGLTRQQVQQELIGARQSGGPRDPMERLYRGGSR